MSHCGSTYDAARGHLAHHRSVEYIGGDDNQVKKKWLLFNIFLLELKDYPEYAIFW